jgi:hypothetical protein
MIQNRREFIVHAVAGGAALAAAGWIDPAAGQDAAAQDAVSRFTLATFSADITPPLGHPLIGGLREPAKRILDPLSALGVVIRGPIATEDSKDSGTDMSGQPLVIAALDWCELRNDAYDQFRDALAKAAGTSRERVLLSCLHQHDAPYVDLTAQKLLDAAGAERMMFDPVFFQEAMDRTAEALQASLAKSKPVTHMGLGQAQVERVACNRRVVGADGKPRFNRYSLVRDPAVRDAPDGEIDPQLKTISFWQGDEPLAALSYYATHPMSYYGAGEVSYDFPGMARTMRQREMPGVLQMYVTGCSGDVVAAKYNEGTPAGRQALADELARGMQNAWKETRRTPLERIVFRSAKLDLPPPHDGPLAIDNLERIVADQSASNSDRVHAAMGLSYRRRCDRGQAIDVPAIDFGPAQVLVLPAELFVGYQLAAQKLCPEQMILAAGFGECAPGYIPTDAARREGFVEEHGYCWVREGVEQPIMLAIRDALGVR